MGPLPNGWTTLSPSPATLKYRPYPELIIPLTCPLMNDRDRLTSLPMDDNQQIVHHDRYSQGRP